MAGPSSYSIYMVQIVKTFRSFTLLETTSKPKPNQNQSEFAVAQDQEEHGTELPCGIPTSSAAPPLHALTAGLHCCWYMATAAVMAWHRSEVSPQLHHNILGGAAAAAEVA